MTIQFEAKLPRKLPESLNVYALDRPKVSNASLTELAGKLGLTGEGKDFISSSDSVGYMEGRWGLEMNRVSGAVSYTHLDRYGIETEKAFDLPDQRADGSRASFSTGPRCSRAAPSSSGASHTCVAPMQTGRTEK